MEEIKILIEKYKTENAEIIKKRPDLQFNNDFSLEGCRLDSNVTFIKDLSVLAKRLNENGGLHKHIVSNNEVAVCMCEYDWNANDIELTCKHCKKPIEFQQTDC